MDENMRGEDLRDPRDDVKRHGGALGGAVAGAIIGSVVPGLGTVVGAAIGGVLGHLHDEHRHKLKKGK